MERNVGGVLGKAGQFGVGPRRCQYLGVAGSDHSSPLSLERARDNGGSARLSAGADDLIDKLDEVVGESYSDLLAHPNTVPDWER